MVFGVCPEGDIDEPLTGTITGTVSGGNVRFDPGDVEELVDFFGEIGCTVVRVDDAIAGTFTGNAITASFSADLECEDVTSPVTFTYRIEATRTT